MEPRCDLDPHREPRRPVAALLLVAAACAGPRVEEPSVPVPDVFPSAPEGPDLPVEAWWKELADPGLDALVALALEENLGVRAAAERLSAARALARADEALGRPAVDVEAGARHASASGEGPLNRIELGLVAAWELDLFGRLDDLRRASARDARAVLEDLEGLRLALSAEVARAYFSALEQRQQLRLIAEQIEIDRTLLELTELRFAQGEASAVDVLQVRGQLAEARALVPPAEALLRSAENRLDVLCGQAPDGRDRTAGPAGEPPPFPALEDPLPVAVPADLLARRPDLRALRERLVAADHRAAAAFSARLPRLTLTGEAFLVEGLASGDDVASPAAAAIAALVQPLIDWGARRAQADAARALERALAAELAEAFLTAVHEVEDLLYGEARQRAELRLLEERAAILAETATEARNRYANGLTDYLPVLTAVTDLQTTQREILRARRDLVLSRVLLFRALGGGVPPHAEGDPEVAA